MDQPLADFLAAWDDDPKGVKPGLVRFIDAVSVLPGARIEFVSRPGVTHSLRATRDGLSPRPLFALADVVEDADGRFLSICFYEDWVADPEERGEPIPQGLLSEDARCFDYESPDEAFMGYIADRLFEASQASLGG